MSTEFGIVSWGTALEKSPTTGSIFRDSWKLNTNILKFNDVNLLEVKIEYHSQFILTAIFKAQIAVSSFYFAPAKSTKHFKTISEDKRCFRYFRLSLLYERSKIS